MRRTLCLLLLVGCGDDGGATADAQVLIDAPPSSCLPQGVTGEWTSRSGNPRMLAGKQFSDGKVDISISDPSLSWDGAAWQLYYATSHGTSYTSADLVQEIRHATSTDASTWSVDDAPALAAATDANAWDHLNTETPTVIENPAAPADQRFLMLYSGAAGKLAGRDLTDYAIGAAFSADGKTFTRIPASMSPHGKDGLVLTGMDAYPTAGGAVVADPELALVNGTYHLWFSSYACTGVDCVNDLFYGISHATSTDGIHWTIEAAPVRSLLQMSAVTTSGGAQPSVVYDAAHCKYEMWFSSGLAADPVQPVTFNNTAGVWHAESTDAKSWTVSFTAKRDLVWDKSRAGEHLGWLTGADVAEKNGGRFMVYVGFDDQNVPAGFVLPKTGTTDYLPAVMTLDLATRDVTGSL